MASSQLHFTISLFCLAVTASIISCGRSHMVLNSALQASHGTPTDEEMPERYALPELQWLFSNSDPAAIQSDSPSLGILQSGLDLMRRNSGDNEPKKPGCKNYFWKSRTAC
ncbi:somatostatin-2-like protein [Labeo rohita]|uniref:Somatostatin-2-like protein n=1 Tax=Labeo rohita TaxID=84645 RepID=A0A498P668_LABRO|nr:somatostatin 2 [Labeo rohita]RXN12332.1 somatostatin-2-like protein [Labeo rohita]RXN38947.1 somatostatin-2-like protein [Labeo rohita]